MHRLEIMPASIKAVAALFLSLLPIALSAQSKYTNKVYGISLEFPAGYKLHRGELGDAYSLGYLGSIPMEFPAPGGVRLATVEVPASLYPNTDFNAAFVTVSVNQYLTREECDPPGTSLPKDQKVLTMKIDGLEFHGADEGDAGLGHQFGGTYYHSFSEGTCYELGEGIATSGYGSVEGLQKLDAEQVFASLNTILRSVRIETAPVDINPAPPPSILSFSVSPRQNSLTGTYRVSWDVYGSDADQVWLSVGCSGDLSISEVTVAVSEGHEFLCDASRPTQSTRGSIDLKFRNLSGSEIQEIVRLFVKGHGAVSRNITVTLPPLPVLITLARYAVYMGASNEPVQLFAGHEVEILGVAFLPHQTLHIGSITLPVNSTDGKNIVFIIPHSMPLGQYPLFIENARGRSNVVTVQLVK
jgi:hypothetical protein